MKFDRKVMLTAIVSSHCRISQEKTYRRSTTIDTRVISRNVVVKSIATVIAMSFTVRSR